VSARLYGLLTDAGGPAFRALVAARRSRGKEDPERFAERFGVASRPRPPGPLVWIHGASVGEAASVLPLAHALLERDPALHVLVTTGTLASAAMLGRRLPPRALHQFVPLDRRSWVRRFLAHWRPGLAIWVESELWPNLVQQTQRSAVPTALVNARVSERSFRRWQMAPQLAAELLNGFAVILAQEEAHAARLRTLGAAHAKCVGNLKFAAPPLPFDQPALTSLRDAVRGRPLWLAASTHGGEEEVVVAVHRRLSRQHPALLTILAPRHPDRADAVAALLAREGLVCARRSRGEPIAPATEIYLADTVGEMGLFFRLAPVAFVGGSLVPAGGHNPIEAARLGCAVVSGPRVANLADIYALLHGAGAASIAEDAGSLASAVHRLIEDPAARMAQVGAAEAVVRRQDGVLAAVLAELEPLLGHAAPRELAVASA
jgi:3-deoxy-D-manno-octulosonic-acid transferase